MRASLVFAALLCFTTWMGIARATHAVLVNCFCDRWSKTEPPLKLIVNYTVQSEGTCPIAAIRFRTKLGKTICSHPSSDWAIKAKAKVDEENRKKALQEHGQTEVGSTSTVTPAEPTTSTKAPQTITKAKVDEENGKKALQEHGQTEEGSTITVTPAEPTTSTKAPQTITKAKVDEENGKKALQEHGQTEVGSTSTVTPAEPTTSTKAPQKITKAKVDEENGKNALQEHGQTEEGSTSSVTPAELTKSKKARQKGGRKGRRLLGRFSRKWRKRQLRRRG
ncbi:uncharacterized protein [Pagrus major]|uniref:uncharacterized protein n=1 Tax=Pagrus major TaxID=143350 RepID=UPI003CC8D258